MFFTQFLADEFCKSREVREGQGPSAARDGEEQKVSNGIGGVVIMKERVQGCFQNGFDRNDESRAEDQLQRLSKQGCFGFIFKHTNVQEINEDKADERAEKRISALDGRINVMRLNVCREGSAFYVDNEKNGENEQAAEKPEKAIRMLLKLRKKGIQKEYF